MNRLHNVSECGHAQPFSYYMYLICNVTSQVLLVDGVQVVLAV
jgi:hypothetical protein